MSSLGIRKHASIGNDCFLGANSIIIGNIVIGDDVLIAAGATVTKDVPAHSVVKKGTLGSDPNVVNLSPEC